MDNDNSHLNLLKSVGILSDNLFDECIFVFLLALGVDLRQQVNLHYVFACMPGLPIVRII